jgi:hypothetical protein
MLFANACDNAPPLLSHRRTGTGIYLRLVNAGERKEKCSWCHGAICHQRGLIRIGDKKPVATGFFPGERRPVSSVAA